MMRNQRGFTLIELMIVVAIIGVLAAIAIPSFMRYIRKAKTAEALQNVEKLYNASRVYYLEEQGAKTIAASAAAKSFPPSSPLTPAISCCANGERCAPQATTWETATWEALNFAMEDPHYFRYAYTAGGSGTTSSFTAAAYGDLDCDGKLSTFSMVGVVQFVGGSGSTGANDMTGSASVYRNNPLE